MEKIEVVQYFKKIHKLLLHCFPLSAILFGASVLVLQTISLNGYIGSDYKIFYWAAERFSENPNNLYQDSSMLSLQGYLYPPPSIIVFMPLRWLGMESGFAVFSFLVFVSTLIALCLWLWILAKDGIVKPSLQVAVATLCLMMTTGSVFSARAGQIDPLILLLCIGSVVLMVKKPLLSGVLIGIGAWIKIYPILLLLHVFLMPKPVWQRVLIGIFVTVIGGAWIAILLMPDDLIWRYFSVILPSLSGRTIVNIYNQSLSAISLRLALPLQESMTTFNAYPVPVSINYLIKASVASLLLIALRMVRQHRGQFYLVALILAAIPLIAPLGWGHTFVYILPLASLVFLKAYLHSGTAFFVAVLAYCLILPTAHHNFSYLEGAPVFVFQALFARYAIATIIFASMGFYFLRREKGG